MNLSPPIVSDPLELRLFAPGDAGKLFAMSQEPGMREWLPDQVYENESHALQVVQYLIQKCVDPGIPSVAPYVLGVCLRSSGELIGHVGLSPLDGGVEIGYAIAARHQGRGFASRAVAAMAEWGAARFALPRVLAIVAAENRASCGVLRTAGFRLVGESTRLLHGRSRLVRTYERAREIEAERPSR